MKPTQTQVLELGRAALVQLAMASIMGTLMAAHYDDETVFPPDTRSRRRRDPTNPPVNTDVLRRMAQLSIEGAEALARAYGPIGFVEDGETKAWSHGSLDPRVPS
jgi:hypothetical protein